jgi:transposase
VMEATGPYSVELTAWLSALCPGLNVVVVRPKLMKDYVSGIGIRNKTDKLDARAIAVFGSERRPVAPEPTEEIYRNLRALTRWRQSLIEQHSALSNLSETMKADNVSGWVRKHLAQQHKQTLSAIELRIDKVECLVKQLVDSHDDLKRDIELLQTIDGVGFRTATAVIGELGDLRRFNTSRQLTAFAGLNPVLKESGTHKGKSRISKQGSPRARRALYMAAMAGIRSSQTHRQRYEAKLQRGKLKMIALTANMRWLVVLMRGVLKSQQPYSSDFDRSCGKPTPPILENAA